MKRLTILFLALFLAFPLNVLAVTGNSQRYEVTGLLTVKYGSAGVVLFSGRIATDATAHWANGKDLDSCGNHCQADWTDQSDWNTLKAGKIALPPMTSSSKEVYDDGFFGYNSHDTQTTTRSWFVKYATCSGTVTAVTTMVIYENGSTGGTRTVSSTASCFGASSLTP
jgi:hypothetical protein